MGIQKKHHVFQEKGHQLSHEKFDEIVQRKRHYALRRLVDELEQCISDPNTLIDGFSRAELDKIDQRLQVILASIRGLRNALLPVHKLPPEVMTTIFYETQYRLPSFNPWEGDVDAYNKYAWMSMLSVCRHWRGIIARSPMLWATVDEHNSDRFLKRSAAAPLTVWTGYHKPLTQELVNKLLPHCERFAQLHVADVDNPGIFLQLMQKPAPELCSLSIALDGWSTTSTTLPSIFQGHLPKLTQLYFKGLTHWPSSCFHGLTHLGLYLQPETNRPSTSEFVEFLGNSPQLEVLSLSNAGPTRDVQTDVPSIGFVTLPNLRVLNLTGLPAFAISRLFSHLSLPGKTDIYIFARYSILNASEDLSSLFPEDTSRIASLCGVDEWLLSRVTIDPSIPHHIAVVGSTLYMVGAFTPSQVDPVPRNYPFQNLRKLRLIDMSPHPLDLRTMLARLPTIRSIEIVCGPATTPGLTRTLVSVLHADSACPRLKSLTIRNDYWLPTVRIDALAAERKRTGFPLKRLRIFYDNVPRPDPRPPNDDEAAVSFAADDVLFLKTHIPEVIFEDKKEPIEIVSRTFGSLHFKYLRMYPLPGM